MTVVKRARWRALASNATYRSITWWHGGFVYNAQVFTLHMNSSSSFKLNFVSSFFFDEPQDNNSSTIMFSIILQAFDDSDAIWRQSVTFIVNRIVIAGSVAVLVSCTTGIRI